VIEREAELELFARGVLLQPAGAGSHPHPVGPTFCCARAAIGHATAPV